MPAWRRRAALSNSLGHQIDSATTTPGAVSSAWEGQTALLHFDPPEAPTSRTGEGSDAGPRWKDLSLEASAPAPLRGVFLTRENPEERHPQERLRAFFGMDGAELAERGVRPGLAVTSHKEGLRMGSYRFAARARSTRRSLTSSSCSMPRSPEIESWPFSAVISMM